MPNNISFVYFITSAYALLDTSVLHFWRGVCEVGNGVGRSLTLDWLLLDWLLSPRRKLSTSSSGEEGALLRLMGEDDDCLGAGGCCCGCA